MSVIGNGGMGSIKKQIFLSLGLFFSCSNLSAMCPQTVGPVLPGESIWQVTSRIGQATNVIESQICALSSPVTCVQFGQSDIGVGGIYTISAPGIYCLKQDVNFSVSPAITVNANNVTIDLQGYYIDGGSNGVSAIQLGVGTNLHSITIENGTIQNLALNGIDQGINLLTNITVSGIDFYNTTGAPVYFAQPQGVQGLLIENCNTFNGGLFQVMNAAGSLIFRAIQAEQYLAGSSGISVFSSVPSPLPSVLVEDCIFTCSAPGTSSANILIANAFNAVIRNCVLDGSYSSGFNLAEINNLVVSDCVVQNMFAGDGFSFAASFQHSNVTFERCVSQYNNGAGFHFETGATGLITSLSMSDCVANSNTSNGLWLDCRVGTGGIQNSNFTNCSTANNIDSGVLLSAFNGGTIYNSTFEGCAAQGNLGDGFAIVASTLIQNVVFKDCVSQANGLGAIIGNVEFPGNGFSIGNATIVNTLNRVICKNCTAQDNAHDGFSVVSTVTACKILDCCALGNTGTGIANLSGNARILGNMAFDNIAADITGVTDPTLIVSSSEIGAAAGATRWVNVVS